MDKFSIKKHYHSLCKSDKETFRDKIMNEFEIDYGVFYSWITRDKIPDQYKEKFFEIPFANIIQKCSA